jgi:hypothetical protein
MANFRAQRQYTARKILTCAACSGTIRRGRPYVRGLTREPYHPDCRRRHVLPPAEEVPRYLVGCPVGKLCNGCDRAIELEDLGVVHVLTKPWHKECLRIVFKD